MLPPIALSSSSPSAPPSSPLVLVLVNVIDEVAVSDVANRFNVVSSSSSLTVATSPPGDEDGDEDVMQRRCRPQRRNGGATTPNAIAASWRPTSGWPNPRRKSARAISSHSPLVRWLVVASTPPPLVLLNPPARHPSRCHPSRCHLRCRPPSQRCGHRRLY